MPKFNDYPFDEVVAVAGQKIAEGWTILQKFTCAGCGHRLTVDTPNTFFETGTCNHCPAITDIRKQGCNYMAMMSGDVGKTIAVIKAAAADSDKREKSRVE